MRMSSTERVCWDLLALKAFDDLEHDEVAMEKVLGKLLADELNHEDDGHHCSHAKPKTATIILDKEWRE